MTVNSPQSDPLGADGSMGAAAATAGSDAPATDELPPAPVRLDELAIPALLLAIGGFLTYGLVTMDVPETAGAPGPRFFPTIVTVMIFAAATVLSIQVIVGYLRSREQVVDTPRTDWWATGTVVLAFLAFAAALIPLGWIVAGALLFWGVARGLGSRRPVFDALLSLGVSSFIQLAFSAGLGLRLPPGIFGWF